MATKDQYKKHWRRWWLAACIAVCVSPVYSQQTQSTDNSGPLASARHLLEAREFAQAEKALHNYLEKDPSSADAHFLLGYALFREKRAKESLAAFTEGAKYQRPGASDLKIVAADYVMLGDLPDADKWLTAVTRETPKDAEAWYLLGRTKYNENRFEEAIRCFKQALALQTNDVRAEDNLGLSYQGLNQLDEAKNAFETAITWQKNSPMKDAQPYMNLGSLLADQDKLQQAVFYLQQAVALAPHNPKAHEELGRVYDLLKMPEKAQQELEQAVALAPDAGGLHFKLGQIYRREGKQELAQQQFDICAKLNSTHSSTETPNPAEQN